MPGSSGTGTAGTGNPFSAAAANVPVAAKQSADSCTRARIRDRPDVIEQRLRLGDFEGDTILGPPGTGGLVTLVDRRSRFTIITKIQSKDVGHVHHGIKQRLKELAGDRCHSLTLDNGTEFACCRRLEKRLNLKLYFADPGCPYQRGTNENTNGLVRQYFSRGPASQTAHTTRSAGLKIYSTTDPAPASTFKRQPQFSSAKFSYQVAIEFLDRPSNQ